mmetsp:Transcript_58057/g.173272  ORF Transcript_58057/g.173272 Transcript_58057/m.173272 type:complete len:279 (-) Transcript_58057:88-924(-)
MPKRGKYISSWHYSPWIFFGRATISGDHDETACIFDGHIINRSEYALGGLSDRLSAPPLHLLDASGEIGRDKTRRNRRDRYLFAVLLKVRREALADHVHSRLRGSVRIHTSRCVVPYRADAGAYHHHLPPRRCHLAHQRLGDAERAQRIYLERFAHKIHSNFVQLLGRKVSARSRDTGIIDEAVDRLPGERRGRKGLAHIVARHVDSLYHGHVALDLADRILSRLRTRPGPDQREDLIASRCEGLRQVEADAARASSDHIGWHDLGVIRSTIVLRAAR